MKNILFALISLCSFVYATSVQTVNPRYELIETKSVRSGVVYAPITQEVVAKKSGLITRMYVDEGSVVKKGDMLAEIDTVASQEAIENAKNALHSSRIFVDSAKTMIEESKNSLEIKKRLYEDALRDFERYNELFKSGVISQRDYEKQVLDKEVKQKEYESYKQNLTIKEQEFQRAKFSQNIQSSNLAINQNEMKYSRIKAEIDGVVTSKYANESQVVSQGEKILSVSNVKELMVEAFFDQESFASLKRNPNVHVEISSTNQIKDAKAIHLVPRADPVTHTYKVKFSIESSGLFPGMYVKIITILSSEKYLSIPTSALHVRGGMTGVFCVEDKKLKFVPVDVKKMESDFVAIEGLNEKAQVVLYPKYDYEDGMSL
ncbi:MAG: HlyD family efflux transporter periplasmic adaptor subunit [Sulfurospirillaceae bacterium]|nr:HlyD family efflux transporter periplasmic adaptor subunit [Sulfurospirillaceae bacterium]